MEFVDFAGATRIPLVGRRSLLKTADQYIHQGGVLLLYIEGESGIGKTAVMEAVLERSQRGQERGDLQAGYVAAEVIDLYRVDGCGPEGLIQQIIQAMGPQLFVQTRHFLDALDRALCEGKGDVARWEAWAARHAFVEEFAGLAEERVVLAFDTAEVLGSGPALPRTDPQDPNIPSAGEWLLKSFFPTLQGNVLLVLAGCPSGVGQKLDAARQRNPLLQVRHVHMEGFSQEETQEYLRSVALMEAERGDADAAARLLGFSKERGDVVHVLTGGRPIFLALVADLVAHGWVLPPAFGLAAEDLQEQGAEIWWPQLEQALVSRIQESSSPLGETIRALAWLRKGATSELLAQVMELITPDGEWDTKTAEGYLRQAAQLSLVKARSDEEGILLHEEMYTPLEKHILRGCSEEERARVYNSILQYYDSRTDKLERLAGQFLSGAPVFRSRLGHLNAERRYYRRRLGP